MPYRRKSYTYSGGDAIFPIPFDFIEENDIFVYIDNEPTTDFIIENHQVKLTAIPQELPVTVLVESKTDIEDSIIEWQNTAFLDEENLILSNNQLLYAIQEVYDNNVQFQTDVVTTIQENKTELENAQNEFETEVNNKIQQVSDAAEKINKLEESVQKAQNSALSAEASAIEATKQAQIAINKVNELNEELENIADNDLSKITEAGKEVIRENAIIAGEKHFLNKTQLTNRILEAPNGAAEYSNVGIVGSLTCSDGVLSDFDNTSCAVLPEKFQPGSNSWEALFKVTTGEDITSSQRIFAFNINISNNSTIETGYGIPVSVFNSKFTWALSTNGTSWNLASTEQGSYTVLPNTTYWVKVNWDGTKYTLAYSLTGDANSFVTDITHNSTSPLKFIGNSAVIGNTAASRPWKGSIDLNSSYIKVNDEIWWEFNGTNPNQVVLKEGLKLLSAVGRNSDGTLNSSEYTLAQDIPCTVSSTDVGYKYIALDTSTSDVTVYENYFSQEETPETSNAVWFKPSENRFYVSDVEGEFSQAHIALFQVFKDRFGFFKGLYPDTAVNLATMDNVDGDWEVNQVVNLASGSSIPANLNTGGTVYTYDVSNYFPDDGCEYEVALSIEINNSAFVICYFWYPQTNNTITFAKGGNPTGGAMTAIVGLDRQIKISVVSSQAAQMWLNIDARKRLARKGA